MIMARSKRPPLPSWLGSEANRDDYIRKHPTHPQNGHLAARYMHKDTRNNLIAYINHPTDNTGVIYYNVDWVLIKDKFPKSTVHWLLIPRRYEWYAFHPLRALSKPDLLASARKELVYALKLAGQELRKQLGEFSVSEKVRRDAMMSDDPPDELPEGRNWEDEFNVGVHIFPSMYHLHIHIFSKDMKPLAKRNPTSDCGKKYQTFNTPFLAGIDEFPLADDDLRWWPETAEISYRTHDRHCWRCKKNFGRDWRGLAQHLLDEYEAWKRV